MVPMPFLFLGGSAVGDSYVSLGGAGDGDGWADVAKFATGACYSRDARCGYAVMPSARLKRLWKR